MEVDSKALSLLLNSAAVGGQTFASPNSGQVEQALENLSSGKG